VARHGGRQGLPLSNTLTFHSNLYLLQIPISLTDQRSKRAIALVSSAIWNLHPLRGNLLLE
jgi:hypothetical protein